MQPILLRSAGVVGLTGAILAVISSGALFAGPEPTPSAAVVAERETKVDQDLTSVSTAPAEGTISAPGIYTPAAGVFTKTAEPPADTVVVASVAPVAALPTAAVEAVEEPAMPASEGGAMLGPTPGADADSEAPSEAPDTALWPEGTVECPRDWVAGTAGPAAAPADCREAAATPLPELAAAPSDQSALDEAAAERASEEAGLEFAARVPLPRPDYTPPAPRKNVTKAGAKRPADPPPNCGKKRAKWRYVNKVPTWYCR